MFLWCILSLYAFNYCYFLGGFKLYTVLFASSCFYIKCRLFVLLFRIHCFRSYMKVCDFFCGRRGLDPCSCFFMQIDTFPYTTVWRGCLVCNPCLCYLGHCYWGGSRSAALLHWVYLEPHGLARTLQYVPRVLLYPGNFWVNINSCLLFPNSLKVILGTLNVMLFQLRL